MLKNVSKGTIIRTAVLLFALLNQGLVASGHSVLPIEEKEFENLLTTLFTIGASLAAWWENNSFTKEAIKADEHLEYLCSCKKIEKEGKEND